MGLFNLLMNLSSQSRYCDLHRSALKWVLITKVKYRWLTGNHDALIRVKKTDNGTCLTGEPVLCKTGYKDCISSVWNESCLAHQINVQSAFPLCVGVWEGVCVLVYACGCMVPSKWSYTDLPSELHCKSNPAVRQTGCCCGHWLAVRQRRSISCATETYCPTVQPHAVTDLAQNLCSFDGKLCPTPDTKNNNNKMHAFEFSYYTDSRACALNSFTFHTLHIYSSQFIYPSFLEGGGDGGSTPASWLNDLFMLVLQF